MFAMRWHDLYGLCVLRRANSGERRWWRVCSYYGVGWEAGQG